MLNIDKFIAFLKEEVALWDKNKVANAWKKGNKVLKNCAIESQSVNRFGVEKSRDLDMILLRGLRRFFRVKKSHSVNRHLKYPLDL